MRVFDDNNVAKSGGVLFLTSIQRIYFSMLLCVV